MRVDGRAGTRSQLGCHFVVALLSFEQDPPFIHFRRLFDDDRRGFLGGPFGRLTG
jgi:hypothetical protein